MISLQNYLDHYDSRTGAFTIKGYVLLDLKILNLSCCINSISNYRKPFVQQ